MLVIGLGVLRAHHLANLSSIVALLSLFFALILVAGGVADAFLPLRRPELIRAAGRRVDDGVMGLPQEHLVWRRDHGLGLFIVFEVVAHSMSYGKFSAESILTLVSCWGRARLIYAVARSVRRQRDALDLGLAMHELPPE